MKLTYYKGVVKNFGDELNEIMWREIIQDGFFDDNEETLFLGIGSIIWDNYPPKAKKVIVGSGYGGYTKVPDIKDGSWAISFVRGPKTAKVLNIEPSHAITDAAILTRFIDFENHKKKYAVSFMPHWESIGRGEWESACLISGIKYIDPTKDVLEIIKDISKSELLLTEAMHGAILADTLRTPWVAMEPIAQLHRNKWFDWSESMNLDLRFRETPASSPRDAWAKFSGGSGLGKLSQLGGKVCSFSNSLFIHGAAKKLLKTAQEEPQLSLDNVFSSKSEQALEAISKIDGIKLKV